jgi:hypothetical protein
MKLVQLYIPLASAGRAGASVANLKALQEQLTERFGGSTAMIGSPLRGLWRESGEEVEEDRIVVFEIILKCVEKRWWLNLKIELEEKFRQKEVLIRILPVEILE